jgi:hypothetical protein
VVDLAEGVPTQMGTYRAHWHQGTFCQLYWHQGTRCQSYWCRGTRRQPGGVRLVARSSYLWSDLLLQLESPVLSTAQGGSVLGGLALK